jgi:hypothetical protein
MGKSILELFKTETLLGGITAEEKYAIRDSKDIPSEPNNKLLFPAFKLRDKIEKSTSRRTRETLFEQETGGLQALMLLSGPVIYGTDLIRLKRKTTDSRDLMVSKANGSAGSRGLLGGVLNFVKNAPKKLGSLLGVKFPEQMIPSRFIDNSKFIAGSSDLPDQISKILRESEGNGFGRFLQKNVQGTPEQIGNQVLSGAIGEGKKLLDKALFGSRKQGANRLAKKPENKRYFDAYSKYSDVVDEDNADITLRKDLSTRFNALRFISKIGAYPFGPKFFATKIRNSNQNSKLIGYAYQSPYWMDESDAYWRTTLNYIGDKAIPFKNSKKPGIQRIGQKMDAATAAASSRYLDLDTPLTDQGLPIPYTDRVDLTGKQPSGILDANDLATYFDSYIVNASQNYQSGIKTAGYFDLGVPERAPNSARAYYSKTDGVPSTFGYDTSRSIKYYREIGMNTGDTLNQQGVQASQTFKSVLDGTTKTLDEIDFITLKIGSLQNSKYVYFRGTIKGFSETFTPAYNQNQGVGMPYPLYTYDSIERTLSFSFDVYSQNPLEHIKAWERLEFLASQTSAQGFTSHTATIPPVISFTVGDLFKNRPAWIETLSYTTDENFPWEIGYNSSGSLDMSCYKLPMIITVQMTLHFIENYEDVAGATTMYDFGKNGLTRAGKMMGTPAGAANTGVYYTPGSSQNTANTTLPQPNPTARIKPVLAQTIPMDRTTTTKGITNMGIPANLKPIVLPSNFAANITEKTNNANASIPAGRNPNDPTGANTDAAARQTSTNGEINDNKAKQEENKKELEDKSKPDKKDDPNASNNPNKPEPKTGEKIQASGEGASRLHHIAKTMANMNALKNALSKYGNTNVRVSKNILDEKTFIENGIYTVKIDIEIEIL